MNVFPLDERDVVAAYPVRDVGESEGTQRFFRATTTVRVMDADDAPDDATADDAPVDDPERGDGPLGVDGDPVEVGVELLAKAEDAELSLAEAMDRVEAVSTAPTVVREILDTAEMRGVIEREDGVVRVTGGGGYVSQTSDVVRREGDYSCRRCGTGLSTGHFVQLDAGELGPFGSECVRKVTGRDS
jgi:hypothetical protein